MDDRNRSHGDIQGCGRVINFAQLPEWMGRNIWMDKIMLSGLDGTYSMVVDRQGYITDTRLLTDYKGNNLPKGTGWFPTNRFRRQFRKQWEDFSMEAYVNNKLQNGGEIGFSTRRELINVIKLANLMTPSVNHLGIGSPEEDVWIGTEKSYVDRTFDHPYLYHYKMRSNRHIRELTDSITVSLYHISAIRDGKVEIIFNVTAPNHAENEPEWNPKAEVPFSVLFG